MSVIIPAYNEASRLPRTLRSAMNFLEAQSFTSEIIVVTDGSADDTENVAQSFVGKSIPVKVLDFSVNRGKGFAVRAGMAAATGEYRVFMDADGAVSIDHVLAFISKAKQGFDVVIGSRALDESQKLGRQPFPREQLAVCFGFLQRSVLKLKIVDTQCGFKLFTAQAADGLFPLCTLDCAYFDAELIYLAINLGYEISQVPVVWKHDNETRLPIGVKRTLDIVRKLFRIRNIHTKTFTQRVNFKASRDTNNECYARVPIN